ncbi:MAG TPA: M56 family metallopeptidase, partial [Pirellulaceae bacterium]|nr:M56 family metallopeptidase [Pirellulaceae bacterium]
VNGDSPIDSANSHDGLVREGLAHESNSPEATAAGLVTVGSDQQPARLSLMGFAYIGLSCLWLGATLLLSARIVAAYRHGAVVRSQGVPAHDSEAEMAREIALTLGVRTPQLLRVSLLQAPCLMGYRRPAILIPDELRDPAVLRRALIHEMAHLRRGDLWWLLLDRVALTLFWFQPLLWRLSAAAAAAAEEVCDDYVIQQRGERADYARQLVATAEAGLPPHCLLGLAMSASSSLLRGRIERILDPSRSITTRLGSQSWLAVGVSAIAITMLAGLIHGIQREPSVTTNSFQPLVTDDLLSDIVGERTIRLRVSVVDSQGRALPGADFAVLAMRSDTTFLDDMLREEVLSSGKSDSGGRIDVEITRPMYPDNSACHVLARASGKSIGWQAVPYESEQAELTVTLSDSITARGRLVDPAGNPVGAYSLHVRRIGKQPNFWRNFVALNNESLLPAIWPQAIVTDEDGWFTVSGIGADDALHLETVDEPLAKHWIVWNEPHQADPLAVFPVPQAQVVTGQVVAGDTGQPIPNATVFVENLFDIEAEESAMIAVRGKADADGRFRINPVSSRLGYKVIGYPPADSGYLPTVTLVDWREGGRETEVIARMERGVLVSGTVTEKATGIPIAGAAIMYLPSPANRARYDQPGEKSSGVVLDWSADTMTDKAGRYQITVLDGAGALVVGPHRQFVRHFYDARRFTDQVTAKVEQYLFNAAIPVDFEPNFAGMQRLDFVLNRGLTTEVAIVNQVEGSELRFLWVGTSPRHRFWFPYELRRVGRLPRLEGLSSEKPEWLYVWDEARHLGARVLVGGHEYLPEIQIELAPCGEARLRLIDEAGRPIAGEKLNPGLLISGRPLDETTFYDFVQVGHLGKPTSEPLRTDAEGNVTLRYLIPGSSYRIFDSGLRYFDFTVETNEPIDLGDWSIK